jgi:hypothetical protein
VIKELIMTAATMTAPPATEREPGTSPVAKKTQSGLKRGSMIAVNMLCNAVMRLMP